MAILEGLVWEHLQLVMGMSIAHGVEPSELVISAHVAFLRTVNSIPDPTLLPQLLRAGAEHHARHYLQREVV